MKRTQGSPRVVRNIGTSNRSKAQCTGAAIYARAPRSPANEEYTVALAGGGTVSGTVSALRTPPGFNEEGGKGVSFTNAAGVVEKRSH